MNKKRKLTKKDYPLYMAYWIWNLKQEVSEHLAIASTDKDCFDKHFAIHKCNCDYMSIFMRAVKMYKPEIYQEKGKSIRAHYEEVEAYLKEKLDW